MGASQAISSHKSMTGVWCYLWCYPACHTLQDFCLQEVELWWNYWCPLLHVMRTWQNHLPIERKVDRPSLKKIQSAKCCIMGYCAPNVVFWVSYCIFQLFQILDNCQESQAARLCESLGADAERRVVQLSFTGCFNFSAPDVLSGQVVGVCNAAKSEENWRKLPGIWDVGKNYHHGCISGEQQKNLLIEIGLL